MFSRLIDEILSEEFLILIGWTFLIFLYLCVEWVYNQHLLIALSYDSIQSSQFQYTEIFGKLVASIGINFVIIKIFKYNSIKGFFFGVLLGYLLLTKLFDTVIESFSDEMRYTSYYSMQYRHNVATLQDKDKLLAFTEGASWYVKPIALTYFFFLQDSRWIEIQETVLKPVERKIDQLNKNKKKYWEMYQKAELSKVKIDKYFSKYEEASDLFNRSINTYIFLDGDGKKSTARDAKYLKKFNEAFKLKPNLSKEEVIKAKFKQYDEYLNYPIFAGNESAGVKPFYAKDIPHEMNKLQFMDFLVDKSTELKLNVAPSLRDVRAVESTGDAVSVLIVPPISVFLSLTSILLNLVLLGWAWASYFDNEIFGSFISETKKTRVAFIVIVTTTLIFGLYFNESPLSASQHWTEAESSQSEKHPVLSNFWKFTLKLEPIICPSKEPENIRRLTDMAYGFEFPSIEEYIH